jgi:hypothetical protein
MRAAVISCIFCLLSAGAEAQSLPATIDALAAMTPAERSAALLQLRKSAAASATLIELQMAARQRVEARRERGLPPHSAGCLNSDEFDLDSQLELSRQSSGAAELSAALGQYRQMVARLDAKLAEARRTHGWARQFPALRRWEREWRAAREPRTRELLLRTLNGQAIRAALAPERRRAAPSPTKGRPRQAPRKADSALARDAFREHVFNLMCADDEENLRWFKSQIAEIGWFGQKEFGWAADQAALLIVHHADTDPAFQESIVASLWTKLASTDTDPENFAYLVDRVAVRAGRPQSFGTQMECVRGEWVVPEIEDHATLDARRKRMNLVAYDVQLARTRALCRD